MNQTKEQTATVDGAFLRALQEHNGGKVLTDLSEAMRKGVEAARTHGKTATLSLDVTFSPNGNAIAFAAEVSVKLPKPAPYDYHAAKGVAGRGAHTAVFSTLRTPEWIAWLEANRKRMSQASFAEWLEEHENLFRHPESKPTGAELKELVLTLEGKQDVRFVSAMRLENQTNRLNYEEDVTLKGQPTTKSESVDLPRTIIAGISPFEGAPPYKVEARFKYHIQSRKLELWFETIDIHKIVRDCVKATVKHVAEKSGIIPLLGTP